MDYNNTTNLTFDEFINLLLKVSSNKKKMIISSISSLILLAIIILNWDSNAFVAYILMTALVSIGFSLSILVIFLEKTMMKKTNKYFEKGVCYQYVFREKDFVVTSITEQEKKSLTFTYSSLNKVVISNDNLYLYPTSVSIYCVSLSGFQNVGDKDEVIKLLTPYQKKK